MSVGHLRERQRLTRSAAYASIAMALFLAVLKGWASWKTGSSAMLGSLADTTLDLVASIATLVGVWIAAMPADEDHRFGYFMGQRPRRRAKASQCRSSRLSPPSRY